MCAASLTILLPGTFLTARVRYLPLNIRLAAQSRLRRSFVSGPGHSGTHGQRAAAQSIILRKTGRVLSLIRCKNDPEGTSDTVGNGESPCNRLTGRVVAVERLEQLLPAETASV